jgi:hypothetical protein
MHTIIICIVSDGYGIAAYNNKTLSVGTRRSPLLCKKDQKVIPIP